MFFVPIYLQSLKLLSVMAVIRLDEKPDKIENILFASLMDGAVTVSSTRSREIGTSTDPLASSTWEEVLFCGHLWFFYMKFI